MIYCSNCGTANRDGSRFCNECGFRLGVMVPCPFCHLPNLSTSRFCNFCGRRLMPGQPLSIEQQLESHVGPDVIGGIPLRAESEEAEEKPSGGLSETEAGEIGLRDGWAYKTEPPEAMPAAVEITEPRISEAERPGVAAAESIATGGARPAESQDTIPRVGATEAALPGVEFVEGQGATIGLAEAVGAGVETAEPAARELDTVEAAAAETEMAPVVVPGTEPELVTASGTEVVLTEVGVAETGVAEAASGEGEAAEAVSTLAGIGVSQLEVAEVGVPGIELAETELAGTETTETEAAEIAAVEVEVDEIEAGGIEAGGIEAGQVEAGEIGVGEVELAQAEVAETCEAEVGEIEGLEPEAGEPLAAEPTPFQVVMPGGKVVGIGADEATIDQTQIDQTQAVEEPRVAAMPELEVAPSSTISARSMQPEPPEKTAAPEAGLGDEVQEVASGATANAGWVADLREPGLSIGEPGFGVGVQRAVQSTDATGAREASLGAEAVSEDQRERAGWIDRGEGQTEELPEWLDTLSTRPVVTIEEPAPQQQLVGAIVVAQSMAKPPKAQRGDDGGEQYGRAAEMLADVIRTSPTIVDAERFRRTVKRGWFGR